MTWRALFVRPYTQAKSIFANMFQFPTNPGNTSPLFHAGKLLALCEAGRCRLTPDVYGYGVRCIRMWGRIRTDIGSYLYGYRVRCGGAG